MLLVVLVVLVVAVDLVIQLVGDQDQLYLDKVLLAEEVLHILPMVVAAAAVVLAEEV
jgi:hypothetical protein